MEINFAQMGKKLWLEKIQDFYHETKVDFPKPKFRLKKHLEISILNIEFYWKYYLKTMKYRMKWSLFSGRARYQY